MVKHVQTKPNSNLKLSSGGWRILNTQIYFTLPRSTTQVIVSLRQTRMIWPRETIVLLHVIWLFSARLVLLGLCHCRLLLYSPLVINSCLLIWMIAYLTYMMLIIKANVPTRDTLHMQDLWWLLLSRSRASRLIETPIGHMTSGLPHSKDTFSSDPILSRCNMG